MRSPVADLLAGPGIEDEFLARAVSHSIDGVQVPVVDVSDLVIMKVLAGRPKDIDNVIMLLRVQGSRIDVIRVNTVLQMLEEALGQSDLLSAFDHARLQARAR